MKLKLTISHGCWRMTGYSEVDDQAFQVPVSRRCAQNILSPPTTLFLEHGGHIEPSVRNSSERDSATAPTFARIGCILRLNWKN